MYLYLRLLCLHFHRYKGRLLGPHPSSLHFTSFWDAFCAPVTPFGYSSFIQHRLFIFGGSGFCYFGCLSPHRTYFSGPGSACLFFFGGLRLGYTRLRRVGGIHTFLEDMGGSIILYIYLGVGAQRSRGGLGEFVYRTMNVDIHSLC